jgi:NarL family two-component system response regulator YdfI
MTKRNGGSFIRVLLAAASSVRRAGLESLIKKTPSLQLAGSLSRIEAIAAHATQLHPDIVLADLEGTSASSARLPEVAGQPPVVALIDEPTPDWTANALQNGVKAILPREATMDEILAAIRAAHAGLVLLDPEVTQELAARVPAQSLSVPEDLTRREIEVLRMLAEGLGNRQMASQLGISDHTIKFHISSILDKLGAATRTEAVTMGIRMGIILL